MAEEERFNRIKNSGALPINSIQFCLLKGGITLSQVSLICFGMQPFGYLLHQTTTALYHLPKSLNLLRKDAGQYSLLSKLKGFYNLRTSLTNHFGKFHAKIKFVEHHLAHIYSSYFISPYRESLILIMDGHGEKESITCAYAKEDKLNILSKTKYPHSLGMFYAAMTQYAGFEPNKDEYKFMALQAFGQDRFKKIFKEIIWSPSQFKVKMDLSFFSFHKYGIKNYIAPKFHAIFNKTLNKNNIETFHYDFSCSVQRHLERIVLKICDDLHRSIHCPNLCLSGGVAQNVVLNSVVRNKGPFKNVFISPISHDGGVALGAALYGSHEYFKMKKRYLMSRCDWGPEFSNEYCARVLKEKKIKYIEKDLPFEYLAKLLSSGKVIGLFSGRMEVGPRALGHRSILADPRQKSIKRLLNGKIKKRESFRPFAPIVTKEDAHKFFDINNESPFMTEVFKIKFPHELPGISHADNTARISTIDKKINPQLHHLLKQFEIITGIPILINTSLNENEPIVCTPSQAIDCFIKNKLDCLVFNYRYIILKDN